MSIKKRKVIMNGSNWGEFNISFKSYIKLQCIRLYLWSLRWVRRFLRGAGYCKFVFAILPVWAVFLVIIKAWGTNRLGSYSWGNLLWDMKASLFSSVILTAATSFITQYTKQKTAYIEQHELYIQAMDKMSRLFKSLNILIFNDISKELVPFWPFYTEDMSSAICDALKGMSALENKKEEYLAYNLNFRKLLEARPVDRVEMAMELNNSVEPILWYYITSDSYVKGIEIITDHIDTDLGSFLRPVATMQEQTWYQSSQEDFSNMWTCQNGELFISRTLLDVATVSKPIGVMRIDLFPATFFEPFEGMQYLGNGILVVDQNGNPIYSRKTTDEVVDEAVYSAIADGNIMDTSSYVLRSGTVPTTGWVVYYYVDSQMITGQLQSILLRTLQVVAAVIAIAFVVITLFSRSLSKRILFLKASAERVASGDLDTVIETNDTDEIGIVINSFGAMTKRLNHLINEIYKMQLEKKAVELKALQAQINPHFLYNALSSINWKAIRQGNDDISQLTSTLATFYRTSLNNGESITSVENELANIRAYVEIQRHMRDFPFCVDYEIEDGVLKLSMLNFLLQPIVENAFKHGIDYTDETQNGRLLITCHTEEEYLFFTVRNNGPQIQEEKARASLKQPGKGYGLFNIQERIALYYGEGCGLSAGLDENGYTCFTVKIKKSCTIDR